MQIKCNTKRNNPFRNIYDDKYFQEAAMMSGTEDGQFPRILDIEVTNSCNLNCDFCSRQLMTRPIGFMDINLLKKILVQFGPQHNLPKGIRFIRWGEPFLHPQICEFIRCVKDTGVLLHITNNGLIITKEHMKCIIDNKVDSIIFSLQGATKEEYEKMRHNDKYEILLSNISLLKKMRGNRKLPYIGITSTMTNDTKEDIDKFIEFWKPRVDSIGIGRTNYNRLRGNNKLNTLCPDCYNKDYHSCDEVANKLSIDWDGTVTACCGDYDNLMVVGHLFNKLPYIKAQTIKEIYNSKLMNSYRDILYSMQHKSLTLCSKCSHAYLEF